MCQGRGCSEDAVYECWDELHPDARYRFCASHYLRAAKNAAEAGIKISTVQP